jgi:hypothetical protein
MFQTLSLVLLLLVSLTSVAQMPPSKRTGITCEGGGGLPKWAVRKTGSHSIRFTIDATLVDTCTIYFDIEFVAKLLADGGRLLETRRFALPAVAIRGPLFASYDFDYQKHEIAGVEGIALNFKKRVIGGLPAANADIDSATRQGMALYEESKSEREKHGQWSFVSEPDFSEIAVVGTDKVACTSGDLTQTGKASDRAFCDDVRKRADGVVKERARLYGDAIAPGG